jgi:phage terminase large subunit GpA-like protein
VSTYTRRSPTSRPSRSSARRLDLSDAHPALVKIIAEAFLLCAPPPDLTVSGWSDAYRVLSPEDSSEPGRWHTSRMEPMRGVMDAFNEPETREIVVKKGTQVGYTAGLMNLIGYCMDVEPCPILMLLPTEAMAAEVSKNRLSPMLRDTPRLRGKVRDARSRDSGNTIWAKSFPGGRLALVGANAPAQLASRPIRVVINDEVDKFPPSAGTQGDPMKLASKRQTWFWNRKTIKGSSPGVKGVSVIDRDYAASDKREYRVPCPDCRHAQTLRWEQVIWDKVGDGRDKAHRPETAHYVCEACGSLWDDAARWQAIRDAAANGGGWVATAPFRGIAGFHLPQFVSSAVTLEDIVTEFLTAMGKLPGTSYDPQLLKVWTNSVLAETWEDQGETVDAGALATRGEPYGPDDLPDRVLLVTAGVDTQGDRLEVQLIGWGVGEESWPFEYRVLHGDPAQGQVWADLDQLLLERFRTRSGRLLRVRAACIDSGGHHANQVHEFCRGRRARKIFPIIGRSGPHTIWPTRASKTKNKKSVFLVGVDTAKDAIYGRLKGIRPKPDADDHNPGYIHFPALSDDSDAFGPEYFAQLTAERVETRKKNGRPYRVWVPTRARNEALDTFVYALAARFAAHVKLKAAAAEEPTDEAAAPGGDVSDGPQKADVPAFPLPAPIVAQKAAPRRRSNWLGSRGSGWMNR